MCVQWSDQRLAKSHQVDTHTETQSVFFQARSIYPLTDSSILWTLQLPSTSNCSFFSFFNSGEISLMLKAGLVAVTQFVFVMSFPTTSSVVWAMFPNYLYS